MNTPLIQSAKESWNPTPVDRPQVDASLSKQNGVQRAAESLRYVILLWEHWVSPNGDIREWLKVNTLAGAWLFIPAICVMPAVGFVLWQLTGWLSMLASIAS